MPNVSIFANSNEVSNPVTYDSEELVKMIREGKWKKEIDHLKSMQFNSKEQQAYKKTLKAITWQGTFTYRKSESIIEHSGLVACDFDNISENDWQKYWDILTNFPHTYALFRSPRRGGMKAIIRIPADKDQHKGCLAGLKHLFRDSPYYDHYDDLARLCFVSHDPDLYFNPEAVPYEKALLAIITEPAHQTGAIPNTPDEFIRAFYNQVTWLTENRKIYYKDGSKHNFLFRLFSACNRAGVPLVTAINMAFERFKNEPQTTKVSKVRFEKIAEDAYKRYTREFGSRPLTIFKPPEKYLPEITEEKPTQRLAFPLDTMPEDIQSLITELKSCLNYSIDFLSISVIWCIATLNGNKYKFRVKNGWTAATTFWFAAVGEPGTMKSHPIETMIAPIKQIDRLSKFEYDQEFAKYEMNDYKGIKPKYKQILVSDSTLEALHIIHNINRRGIGLFKDELIGFLNDMNRYRKGSDEQFWLESFNNKSYVVNRVTREPILIEDTMINILGSIQPTILTRLTKDFAGNGMIDRFLFTTNETGIYPISKRDIDPEWMDWWKDTLIKFNDFCFYTCSEDTVLIEMSTDALDCFIEADKYFCSLQTSDTETNALKNYVSKMKTYLPRFALVFWLLDTIFTGSETSITSRQMIRAQRICEYFIASAREVFDDSDKRQELDDVTTIMRGQTKLEKIIALHNKGFKNNEIARKLNTPASYVSKTIKDSKVI